MTATPEIETLWDLIIAARLAGITPAQAYLEHCEGQLTARLPA